MISYLDTAAGAQAALKAMANAATYRKMIKLDWKPGQTAGVWEVFEQEDRYVDGILVDAHCRCVVYLAGYPEPFGNIRKQDDFEGGE